MHFHECTSRFTHANGNAYFFEYNAHPGFKKLKIRENMRIIFEKIQ